MRHLSAALFAGLLLVVTISAAHAQLFGGPTRYAVSGKTLLLYETSSTNPDCTSSGTVEIRILQPPQNGRVFVSSRSVFPRFPETNIRSVCNRRRVPGIQLSYVSRRGYTGPDSAVYEVIWPQGIMRRFSASIMVR